LQFLIIRDIGTRKLPHTAAEAAGGDHAPLRTGPGVRAKREGQEDVHPSRAMRSRVPHIEVFEKYPRIVGSSRFHSDVDSPDGLQWWRHEEEPWPLSADLEYNYAHPGGQMEIPDNADAGGEAWRRLPGT
jgi:hypothetical protein